MAGRLKVAGHIQKGGKSLMVQRQFARLGIVRMYRSSGTTDKNEFLGINNLLSKLADLGTSDAVAVLKKLAAGEARFLDALAEYNERGLKGVLRRFSEPSAPIDKGAFLAWVNGAYTRTTTRAGYYANYRKATSFAKPGESMKDLPAIMGRYRVWCVEHNRNFRAWDYALAVCQAWVRDTLGDEVPVYRALRKLERFDSKPDPRAKQYFSPRDVMNVCQKLPEDVAAMVWSMAVYGAGPKEYMEDGWKVENLGLHIFGQKHKHRDRTVPLLLNHLPAKVAPIQYRTLLRYISKASGGAMTPYSLRNAYPRWLLAADVPYNRVQMYQGHAEASQTDTYAFHDTQQFLSEDAAKLEAWLSKELSAVPASPDREIVAVGPARGWSTSKRGGFDSEVRRSG